MKLLPNGEPRFTRPNGRAIPLAPVPPVLAEDPITAFEQRHRQEDLEIDDDTGLPSWDGGSWDLNWALEALRPIGGPKDVSAETPRAGPAPPHDHLRWQVARPDSIGS